MVQSTSTSKSKKKALSVWMGDKSADGRFCSTIRIGGGGVRDMRIFNKLVSRGFTSDPAGCDPMHRKGKNFKAKAR